MGSPFNGWMASRNAKLLANVYPVRIFENVLVGASGRGQAAYTRCIEVLELCGLVELANRRADSLGLLHRKRLELARALATNPTVLLLDEIGGGLTDAEADDLLETIREVRRHDVTILWIEHIVHVLMQVIDRLVCLDVGRVIADGEPDAVIRDAAFPSSISSEKDFTVTAPSSNSQGLESWNAIFASPGSATKRSLYAPSDQNGALIS